MKKSFLIATLVASLSFLVAHTVEARGRYRSHRIGGYNRHGKGSRYIGGYIRSCHGWSCK